MHTTIPAENYLDPAVYAMEMERVYKTTWQYVGHVERLRNPGDFFTSDVAGQSLIVIRDDAGAINAFHNVCSHRAARLLDGEGCKKRFSCPYHGWTYDSLGHLIAAPNAANVEAFDKTRYGLRPCAVEVMHGLVFVNLVAAPASLDAQAEGLEAELKDYAPALPDLRFVHRTEATLRANWKIVVENYSECYHCQLVHKDFVNGVVDPESYRIRVHGLWQKHLSRSRTGTAKAYEYEETATHSKEFGAWYLWPNFAFQSYPGGAVHVWKWTPIDPGTTHVAVDWYFPETKLKDWEQDMIRHHAETTFAEDIPIVESVQKGLSSQAYNTGPLMIDPAGSVMSEHAVAAIQSLWRDAMEA